MEYKATDRLGADSVRVEGRKDNLLVAVYTGYENHKHRTVKLYPRRIINPSLSDSERFPGNVAMNLVSGCVHRGCE